MGDDSIFLRIVFIFFILFIIGAIVFGIMEEQNYTYICTDYKGDTIYCNSARWTKGGLIGTMEDGTEIVITSYKRIKKEGN